MRFLFILISVCNFWGEQCFAQLPVNYASDDVLSSLDVSDLEIGENRLINIATEKGFMQFDGIRFKEYQNNQAVSKAVYGPSEDAEGKVWMYNFSNQIFFYKEDSLYLFKEWGEIDLNRSPGNVKNIEISKDGERVIIIADLMVFVWNIKTQKIIAEVFSLSLINAILFNEQLFILSHENGLQSFELHGAETDLFGTDYEEGEMQSLCFEEKDAGYTLSNGRFYILENKLYFLAIQYNIIDKKFKQSDTKPYLWRLDDATIRPVEYPPFFKEEFGNLKIVDLVKDPSTSAFWYATSKGLIYYDKLTKETKHYFVGDEVSSVAFGKEGLQWIGVKGKGLNMKPFPRLLSTYDLRIDDDIVSIAKDETGNLLLGTQKGVLIYYNPDQKEILYKYDLGSGKAVDLIRYDSEKRVFLISSKQNWILDVKQPSISLYHTQGNLRDVVFDSNRNSILALAWEIFLVEENKLDKKQEIPFYKKEKYLKLDNQSKARDIFLLQGCCAKMSSLAYQNGSIFVADEEGFKQITEKGKSVSIELDSMPIFAVDLLVENDSVLWVATLGKGLLRLVNGVIVKRFTEENHPSFKEIKKLGVDNQFLWINSRNGISAIRLRNDDITYWGKYQGVIFDNIKELEVGDRDVFFPSQWNLI